MTLNTLDWLLKPLTERQQQDILNLFDDSGLLSQAEELLACWPRIAEVAHQHALRSYMRITGPAILLSKSVRQRRDRQHRQATAAALAAVANINDLLKVVAKHADSQERWIEFEKWAHSVTARLVFTAEAFEKRRIEVQQWPAAKSARGKVGWLTESALLEVVVAFFRKNGWRVTQTPRGLPVRLFGILLVDRAMSSARLKRLAHSRVDFDALESTAPRGVKASR